MTNIEPGQIWEVYSTDENRWNRVIVTKIEDGRATLRYEGVLEFLTVDVGDMQSKPEVLRPAANVAP